MINTSKEKNKYIKSQKKIHQTQAPKYNLAPKQKKKLPLSTCMHMYSPIFVMNCQRAIMTHHQKVEVAE